MRKIEEEARVLTETLPATDRLGVGARRVAGLLLVAVMSFVQSAGQAVGTEKELPDLSLSESWAPSRVPFSFVYGGVSSTGLLSRWQFSEEADRSKAGVRRYDYVDPATRLKVVAEVRSYADFPGVTDWVIYFKNEGNADTPILENILPFDWGFPSTGRVNIHHARGSTATANDFEPLQEHFWPQGHVHLEATSGRSSSGESLPYFNLQAGNHGYIAAIGWSGGWKADFDYNKAENMAQTNIGMRKTHLLLHPGEEIRTPRIVWMRWSGASWEEPQNRWRRLLFAHYTPHDDGRAMVGPVLFGGWGSEAIGDKLAYIDWVHQNHIPVDVYATDAGWYGASVGEEGDPTNPWWKNRGDWFPSSKYYPQGIRPLGAALKAQGIGFSLWIEPEVSVVGTRLYAEHPDWFLRAEAPLFGDHPHPGMAMVNLGNPAALAGITKLVSGLISDFEMTWYRQDFNVEPNAYWEAADTPDRVGMTEIGHVEGLYKFWDALLAEHPGLRIDNCASGGRRLDIEMMSRSFSIWRTDYGFADRVAEQAQTQALAYWVPQNMGFGTAPSEKPWTKPGPYDTPEARYLMRLGYDAGYGLTPGAAGVNNLEWVEWIKNTLAEYREVQPYFYGDFYPLLSYTVDPDAWTAWQWDRPEKHDGLVMALRRAGSPYPIATLAVKKIEPKAIYDVEMRMSYGHAKVKQMKGGELAHLILNLPNDPDSILIFYRRR
jgi:alpha-galactosidase